jgi:hypothetical protein
MAIAEEASAAHTVLAARRHCLEMATCLVEPPIDYLESVLGILVAGVKDNASYIITHGNTCLLFGQLDLLHWTRIGTLCFLSS